MIALIAVIFGFSSCVQKKNAVAPGELDIQSMIQPIPTKQLPVKNHSLSGGGSVVHLTAISDKPEGPFVKQYKPIFTAENVDFSAEDPFVWYQDNCYYAIVKDMNGAFTNAGRSLVLFYSLDGLDWKLAKHPLVSDLNIKMADGSVQKLEALERPQLFFENGKLMALLTGNYPYRYGLHEHIVLSDSYTGIPGDAKTIAEKMKEGGYRVPLQNKLNFLSRNDSQRTTRFGITLS